MGCCPEKYVQLVTDLLEAIDSKDIKLEKIIHPKKGLIGYKIYGRAKLNNAILFVNVEHGLFEKGKYKVSAYGYHYDHPRNFIRFDSHHNGKYLPHANHYNGEHLYYGNGFRLETKDLNLVLVVNICQRYEYSNEYPLDEENIDKYNKLIDSIRRSLR